MKKFLCRTLFIAELINPTLSAESIESAEQKKLADLKSHLDRLNEERWEAHENVYGNHACYAEREENTLILEYKDKKRNKAQALYEIAYAQQYRSTPLLWTPEIYLLIGNFLVYYKVKDEDARSIMRQCDLQKDILGCYDVIEDYKHKILKK